MQVHAYRLPDDLAKEYCRFSRATLEQLQHYFCRKLAESSTVDTLIVDLSGGAFEPGDPFPGWWDAKARAYRAISADNMSRREFFLQEQQRPHAGALQASRGPSIAASAGLFGRHAADAMR